MLILCCIAWIAVLLYMIRFFFYWIYAQCTWSEMTEIKLFNQNHKHKQKYRTNQKKQNKKKKQQQQQRASWLYQNQEKCDLPCRIGSEHRTDDLIICQTGTHDIFVYTDIFVQTDIKNIIFLQLMSDWRQLWHAWYILRYGFQTFILTVSHCGYLSWPWLLDTQVKLSLAWNNQSGTASCILRWPEIVMSDVTVD